MQIFKNRPLALAVFCFVITALIAFRISGTAKLIGCIILGISAVFCIFVVRKRQKCGKWETQLILCFFGIALALFQSWFYFNYTVDRFNQKSEQEITVEGYVTERLESGNHGSRFAVNLHEVDGERFDAKILLECNYLSALQVGDQFRLNGTVRLPMDSISYAEETVLCSDGFVGIITCDTAQNCSILDERTETFLMLMQDLRSRLVIRFQTVLGGEESALASALFLGERSDLSGDTVLDFSRSGISHLLALSGLHISILIFLVEFLLRKWKVRKPVRAIFIPISAGLYLLLTGCALSTLRAVLMLCVLYLSFFLYSDYDSFTSLSVTLFLILVAMPYAVADVSLWMSYTACAGIVIFVPEITNRFDEFAEKSKLPKPVLKILKTLLSTIAVGLFANAVILPLLAYFFGTTSLFSVGVTMILSPLVALALISSILILVFPWCAPMVAVGKWIFHVILTMANRVSNVPNAVVLLNDAISIGALLLLTGVLICFAVVKLEKKRLLFVPVLLSVLIPLISFFDVYSKELGVAVTYIREEYEEALVFAEGKTAIVFDCSKGSKTITARIQNAILESKCTELQELVVTHYHPQTAYMIASLSSDMKIRTLRLPVPNCEKEFALANRLEQEANLHGITVCYGTENLPIDGMEIQSLERSAKETAVEVPVLMAVELGEKRLVYLGGDVWNSDLEAQAKHLAMSSDLLIFGVHGTSSVPNETFYSDLSHSEYIIFGNQPLFDGCPMEYLPKGYCTEIEYKRFFIETDP